MRPVRLTIQAFGSYAGREVIDFRGAVEAGLFGIYGPTGSGKSTIFGAMTFALFGKVAKDELKPDSLRAHRAEANMPTEVEFVFDIGERRYVVRRNPRQMRPKKSGEGETAIAAAADLFDATGLSPEAITRADSGRMLAEKKTGVVDAAIVDLLGYRHEQFCQIVLLPQGQFEKFLAAKSPDRLVILRELFDVSLYRTLADHLKAEAASAEKRVTLARAVCAERLGAAGFESVEALTLGIAEAGERRAAREREEGAARKAAGVAEAAVHAARQVEGLFEAETEARAALAALHGETARIEALKERIAGAERARALLEPERRAAEAAGAAREAATALETATRRAGEASAKAEAADRALTGEIGRAAETDGLAREADTLERHAKDVAEAARLAAEAETARGAEREANARHGEAVAALGRARETARAQGKALAAARGAEGERQRLDRAAMTFGAAHAEAIAFEKAGAGVDAARGRAADLTTARDVAAREAEEARDAVEEIERGRARLAARHLAADLAAGDPCPVCGATDHPAPATGAGDAADDTAYRAAKTAAQEADTRARKAEAEVQGTRAVLAEREANLAALARPPEPAGTVAARQAETAAALDRLGPPVDIAAAEAALDTATRAVETTAEVAEALREALATCKGDTIARETRHREKLSGVPEALHTPAALATETARVAGALAARRTARTAAETANAEAQKTAIIARKDHETAEATLAERTERRSMAQAAFRAELAGAELSERAFADLKPAIPAIGDDRAAVERHGIDLGTATTLAGRAARAIEGHTRPALPEIEARRDEAAALLTGAVDARANAGQIEAALAALRADLADTLRKLDEEEAATGPLRELAAMANGANAGKLTLETFAIGAMFDRVLEAANLRFGPMMRHQYRLERDFEETGGGRRGLGMQVFDAHTGRTRATSTLSGGEGFIAALSLALGLADVVEGASGRVRLDTTFIDEGFGSLDTENGAGTLDQVLDVLRTLTGGSRAVGLISHVPLVQEKIPNGFRVGKGAGGSRIEVRDGF